MPACTCRRDSRGLVVEECARCRRLIDAADSDRLLPFDERCEP